jgi:hypothetical protein
MQGREMQRFGTLARAQYFLKQHANRLPATASSSVKRMLDECVEYFVNIAISGHDARLYAQASTARLRELKAILIRDYIAPITAVANVSFREEAERILFRMPRGNPATWRIIEFARSVATFMERHLQVFVDAGLPADTPARLLAHLDEMKELEIRRSAYTARRIGTGTGVRWSIAQGREIVAALDKLVLREAHDDPDLIEAWRNVTRVGLHAPRKSPAVAAPAATPQLPAADVKLLSDGTGNQSSRRGGAAGSFLRRLIPGRKSGDGDDGQSEATA